jgi:hypothetical protein
MMADHLRLAVLYRAMSGRAYDLPVLALVDGQECRVTDVRYYGRGKFGRLVLHAEAPLAEDQTYAKDT